MNELKLNNSDVNLAVFKDSNPVSDADKEKVREYSKLVKMQENLHNEIKKVSRLISFIDAKWCRDYLWVNKQGDVIPVFDIEDSYLKNIYTWSLKNKRQLSKQILKEYIARFGVPEVLPNEDSMYSEKYRGNASSYSPSFDEDEVEF